MAHLKNTCYQVCGFGLDTPSALFMQNISESWLKDGQLLYELTQLNFQNEKEICLFLLMHSVTSKKSRNVDKSCPKMISLEKLKMLTPLLKIA